MQNSSALLVRRQERMDRKDIAQASVEVMLGGLNSRTEWGADSGIQGSANSNVLEEESFNGWMERHHIFSPSP